MKTLNKLNVLSAVTCIALSSSAFAHTDHNWDMRLIDGKIEVSSQKITDGTKDWYMTDNKLIMIDNENGYTQEQCNQSGGGAEFGMTLNKTPVTMKLVCEETYATVVPSNENELTTYINVLSTDQTVIVNSLVFDTSGFNKAYDEEVRINNKYKLNDLEKKWSVSKLNGTYTASSPMVKLDEYSYAYISNNELNIFSYAMYGECIKGRFGNGANVSSPVNGHAVMVHDVCTTDPMGLKYSPSDKNGEDFIQAQLHHSKYLKFGIWTFSAKGYSTAQKFATYMNMNSKLFK